MTRLAVRRRKQKSLRAGPGNAGSTGHSRNGAAAEPTNQLLVQLSPRTRDALLAEARYVELRAGQSLAHAGDPVVAAYFPEGGLVSLISEMTTGHQIAIAAIGGEGMTGFGVLCGLPIHAHTSVTLLASRGYLVRAERLVQLFGESADLRKVAMTYMGARLRELTTTAACNRVHSHRQRLSRWLLIATDKSGQRWLPVTHDVLAQLVGGPRHAVTTALNQLREKGAIAYRRGRIDILERPALVDDACECYEGPGHG